MEAESSLSTLSLVIRNKAKLAHGGTRAAINRMFSNKLDEASFHRFGKFYPLLDRVVFDV